MEKIRIAKYLSSKNLCSRRVAEKLILEGKVTVNGETITTPVFFVDDADDITFQGNPVEKEIPSASLWAYYKPCGEITTHKDPAKRPTVFEAARKHGIGRVISIGRLDINSEGLLLLTNNSALAHKMERPSEKIIRQYKVRVFGKLDLSKFSKFCQNLNFLSKKMTLKGISIDNFTYAPITIELFDSLEEIIKSEKASNFWCLVSLIEGKNREIRKVMSMLGLQVNRLIRLVYGDYLLDDMKPGELRKVPLNV
jgi:23S rRNA pseudouridine2605 synthase